MWEGWGPGKIPTPHYLGHSFPSPSSFQKGQSFLDGALLHYTLKLSSHWWQQGPFSGLFVTMWPSAADGGGKDHFTMRSSAADSDSKDHFLVFLVTLRPSSADDVSKDHFLVFLSPWGQQHRPFFRHFCHLGAFRSWSIGTRPTALPKVFSDEISSFICIIFLC